MADDIVSMICVFWGVVTFFWLFFTTIRRIWITRMQSQVRSKLIEKIGSSQELLNYLESDSGKELVASLSLNEPSRGPHARILNAVQAGLLLFLVGVAFPIVGSPFPDLKEGFIVTGGLAIAAGLGFLISAAISYRMSKAFGLLDRERDARKLAA